MSQKKFTAFSDLERLQSIKSSLFQTINCKKKSRSIEADYRSKVRNVYKEKLKKVFHPLKMEERQDILKFQNYMDDYVKETEKLKEVVQNDQPYTNQTIQKMTKSDIFDILLTLDVNRLCEITCSKYPEKPSFSILTEIEEKIQQNKKLPKIIKKNLSKKHRYPQSPIVLSLLSSKNKVQSPKSPLKRSQFSNVKDASIRSSQLSIKKYNKYNQNQGQPYFNSEDILNRLNQINSFVCQSNTFRMKKQDFGDFLKSKHSNEILISYFGLPQMLTIQNIVQMLNTLYHCSQKEKLMIAFLTYDVNQDGFICENDLFSVSKQLNFDSVLNADIQRISQYCKQKQYILSTQTELPDEFYKNPKRSTYLNIFENQHPKKSCKNLKLPEINQRNPHFTIQNPVSQRQKFTYSTIENERTNVIKINFKIFQQIFSNAKCHLIEDLLNLFAKKQEKQKECQQLLFVKLKRKMSMKSVRFHSQSLSVRNTNRSIQGIRQKLGRDLELPGDRFAKIKNSRANTQGVALESILREKCEKKQKKEKIIMIDNISTKSQTNKKSQHQHDDKCSICCKEFTKRPVYGQRNEYPLSKQLVEKLSVFRTDRLNLGIAHGILKFQNFSLSATP